jgi:hypothetical protein
MMIAAQPGGKAMRTLIFLAAGLAACTTLPQSDRGPLMGQVDYEGQSWPIYAWPNGNWRLLYSGRTVRCTWPTVESCNWSLRHYVNTQIRPFDP